MSACPSAFQSWRTRNHPLGSKCVTHLYDWYCSDTDYRVITEHWLTCQPCDVMPSINTPAASSHRSIKTTASFLLFQHDTVTWLFGLEVELWPLCPSCVWCDRYSLMQQCWQEQPTLRPSFTDLRNQLDVLLEKNSSAEYLCLDNTYYCTDSDSDDCDSVFMFGHATEETDITCMTSLPEGDCAANLNNVDSSSPEMQMRGHSSRSDVDQLRVSICSTEHLLPSRQISGSSSISETQF